MENRKNLRLVLMCFVPALIIGVILLVTPFIVSYARTHNRIYFYDYYAENVLDVDVRLNKYTAAGDKDYFVCAESLEQLGDAISVQLPEAEIQTYENSILVKQDKSYYYITACGENTYSVSNMAQLYNDGVKGTVSFLMPCHLTELNNGVLSIGAEIKADGGYEAWKDFYTSLDRPEEYTFNDGEQYIETLCRKGTSGTVQGMKLKLQFGGNDKVIITSVK